MKRLLALLLLLCLLAGCGSAPETPAETPEIPIQFEPETPEEPETPPAPAPTLMDGREPLDEDGVLWYLPNEAVEEFCYQDLYPFGGELLVTGLCYTGNPYDGDPGGSAVSLRLAVLSPETGQVLCETTMDGVDSPQVQICGDRIAICDCGSGTVFLLDNQLRQTADCHVADEWETFYANASGDMVYLFSGDNSIVAVDLASGQRTPVLENVCGLYTSGRCGNAVTINYVDSETLLTICGTLDLETGEIRTLPVRGEYYGVESVGDVWIAGVIYQYENYLVGTGEDPSVLHLPDGTLSLLPDSARLLITRVMDDGVRELSLYEADGRFLSSFRQNDGWNAYYSEPVWSERWGGYLFTSTDSNGKVRLMFWDLAAQTGGTDLELTLLSALTEDTGGTAVAQELYDRAAALSEQYGVHIKIADQCATEYNTYTVVQDLDYWHISTGLDSLETALSNYPEGFMEQLLYGTYYETEINLTGALTPVGMPEDANGFTSFAAFVEPQNGKHVVVMDLGQMGYIEENFYHEMSHIIDDKLRFDSIYREDALYSEEGWMERNPPGFIYCYDYDHLSEDVYTDGWDSYFIDTYARTFPTEDRARVIEYAMIGWDWMFSEEVNAPLREKLRYYAACIRDAFDTTGWPEVTLWEEPLQNSTTGGTSS